MPIPHRADWISVRRGIFSCTAQSARQPNQKTMIITMIPAAFPVAERAFPDRAVIIKKDKKAAK